MSNFNSQKIKTLFVGTGHLASPILLKLLEKKYSVVAVVTKADKKIGGEKNRKIAENPVKDIALENNISLWQPEKLNAEFVQEIKNLQPDLIIVVCYGKIIPEEILNIPKFGSLNVHVSLLPKLRGASPVQNAILEGLTETGVTIIKMDSGMDSGEIIAQEKIEIEKNDTTESLSAKIFPFGAELLVKILPNWIEEEIETKKQDENQVTFCKILKREDGKVDWTKNAEEIYNQFRAFTLWPGIFTFWEKEVNKKIRIKLTQIKIAENSDWENFKEKGNLKIGEVFLQEKKVFVIAKNSAIEILELQSEGKSVMKAKDFINGNKSFVGSVLK